MARKSNLLGILLIAAVLLSACAHGSPEPAVKNTEPVQPDELESTSTPAFREEASAETDITAPDKLSDMLEKSGIGLEDLNLMGCTQLVTVGADGASAEIDLYVLENGRWHGALSCGGYVGSNGTTGQKQEGDRSTPKGLYPIGEAFYIGEAPQTGLAVFQITGDTYWVDDPASAYYNQRVEGEEHKDWNSAEHMGSYGASYEYGFVIGYNLEATPNAGSAIFFHVGDCPTAGCVVADREEVLQVLAALDAGQTPCILIN